MARPSNAEKNADLADLLDRVLETGVAVRGDVTISVAGVDLVYLDLRLLLTSARKMEAIRRRDRSEPPTEDGRQTP